jgi:Flp pilus assembly protein TadD
MLLRDVGRRKAAERWFARACDDSRSQDCDWLWVIRGANLAVTERHTEAEHCYKQAIKINPRNDEAYLNLGTLYRAMGRFEDAHRALRHGYLLDPTSLAIQKALDSVASVGQAKVWVDQLESEGT